ncbi:DNA-directed RNA polymerase, beta subunit (macronuclear) [Tetrahymena thermophila SB210]|uniref:DNA-directed RNA polymerase n=1 Tax=Tetrahymena thermophila (strain SB210) TaxID=312017 RepID=Q23U98_TETTS|nr:DNA-directed RNA polymerase, beta subunit [Tetrahymena thermophila SB210]EAS00046.2 DNA-directed RNA polymerase, beta subunit [Tetrahymena thermophila SB210]|eukprot:XP_001020291.2 DNA-directed RNA polymerase, beta subunit [Tetrahymena thermophila SB210]
MKSLTVQMYVLQYCKNMDINKKILLQFHPDQQNLCIYNVNKIQQKLLFRNNKLDRLKLQEDQTDIIKGKNGDVKNFQHDLNYEKLDENGLIREGSVVRKGDIVIGKILILNQEDQIIDRSIKFEYEEGIILKVKQINVDGQQKIIIRFIIPLYPQIGDKYAARCGQKGTIGTIRDENQMPYTNDGTPIDIIINPCSFSTRMTIGMNIEQYTSYLVLLTGLFLDSSMFCDVKDQLNKTYKHLLDYYNKMQNLNDTNQSEEDRQIRRNIKKYIGIEKDLLSFNWRIYWICSSWICILCCSRIKSFQQTLCCRIQ